MIAIGHTAVGVIIGLTAYNFIGEGNLAGGLMVATGVSIASHYIADATPHGHFFKPDNYKKRILPIIIFDLFIPILFFLSLIYLRTGLSEKFLYILFSIGGSQLPDVLDGLIYTGMLKPGRLLKIENIFHQNLHWHGKGPKTLLLGFLDIWQVFIILLALYMVIRS